MPPQLFLATARQLMSVNGILVDPDKLALVEPEGAVHSALLEEVGFQLSPISKVLAAAGTVNGCVARYILGNSKVDGLAVRAVQLVVQFLRHLRDPMKEALTCIRIL